mgnify:FL=1
MWFWLSLIALLCWSGSDLFSKIGCRDADDHLAHLKMVIAVGVVMGLHAAYEIFIGGVSVTWHVIWTYLPVSLLYIVSMALGYVGLRYIELSISSPICNASGAVVAVLYLCFGGLDEDLSGGMRVMVLLAIALVCVGVIGLGVVESREDDELRRARLVPSQDPDLGGKVVRFCAEMECDARLRQPLHTPFRACSRDGQPRHAEKKPDHPPHPRRPPSP